MNNNFSGSPISLAQSMPVLKSLAKTATMPVVFVGHGSPMNAFEDNSFTQEWRKLGASLHTPQVIVVMSAHWVTSKDTYITAMPHPETIYDFYGFPQELYNMHYRAPGNHAFAQELSSLKPQILTSDEWGFDHGTWSVLAQMYPEAKIPVLQLSINDSLSPSEESALIAELQFLRQHGVLFIGSGNIIHNLRMINWEDKTPFSWAVDFDAQVKGLIEKRDVQSLAHYHRLGSAAQYSIPTDEHYRPMLGALALASDQDTLHFFNEEILMGSVGMRSFVLEP